VLFDEPLTVIDPHLKWLLRRKLKEVHEQLRLTLIYVTHDQTEALTFADSVIVMTRGEVAQRGTPEQLFEAPANRFVGHFIGTPGMNFLDCEWADGQASVAGAPLRVCSATQPSAGALAVGVRPEYVSVQAASGPNCVPAQVISTRDQGVNTMVELRVGAQTLWARLPAKAVPPASRHVFAQLPAERCALYVDGRREP
jgi:glycerol transport system ATP-binding protein